MWVVVLCRGGHFAAAAFELRVPPKGAASRRGEDPNPNPNALGEGAQAQEPAASPASPG